MLLFFQIAKKAAPFYLTNRISFRGQIQERSTRAASRHSMLVKEPRCRLNCYKTSFFPDCIRNWNALTSTIVNCSSIDMFKLHLFAWPSYESPAARSTEILQYNKVLKGHNGKLIIQFRLGLSALKNELFTYNIADNPFCPACGNFVETLSHYLFICASYSAQRTVFMNDMNALIDVVNIYFNLTIDIMDSKVLIHLITHGLCLPMADCEANYFVNSNIFNIVSKYLTSTCRFKNTA